MPHSKRHDSQNSRLNQEKFTLLEMSDAGTGSTTSTALTGAVTSNLVTATKKMSPYITLRSSLLIILFSCVIVAVAVVAAVLIISHMKTDTSDGTSQNASAINLITTRSSLSNMSVESTLAATSSSSSTPSAPLASMAATSTSTSIKSTLVTPSPTTSRQTTMSLLTTSIAPVTSLCKTSEFMCSTTVDCIPRSNVCDGLPDCPDGSDESLKCTCDEDQFQCSNNQCIPKTAVCNQKYDCLTKEDEANCSDCHGFTCVSNKVCLWDQMTRRCDGFFDCDDYSDEVDCSRGLGYSRCKNGVEVRNALWCDGLDDCGDNTDEENCVCKKPQKFACTSEPQGQCIRNTWMCDGIIDCDSGADEIFCANCSASQFQCKDYSCIPKRLQCDGKVDCKQKGGDEDNCVSVTPDHELRVTTEGIQRPVCWDTWVEQDSSHLCSAWHKRLLSSWPSSPADGKTFAVLKNSSWNILNPVKEIFEINAACTSGEIVNIQCQEEAECGKRQADFLESFVAGGGLSPLGKWPWVVSLSYRGSPICGGVLIDQQWVLTAAHCIMTPVPNFNDQDFKLTPFYFAVTAGSTLRLTTSETANQMHQPQVIRVGKIWYHPQASLVQENGGVQWDLALLKLETNVTFGPTVQPLCLPSDSYLFTPNSYCYLAGWGLLSYRQNKEAQKLRDARMQVWSEDRCSKNKVIGETSVDINSTICTGYINGLPTGCPGDSGSPLMCLDTVSGHYILAGIMSLGRDSCGQFQSRLLSNRFARVSTAVQWIQRTMNSE